MDSFRADQTQQLEMWVACNNADFKAHFAAMKQALNEAQLAELMAEFEDGADLIQPDEFDEVFGGEENTCARAFLDAHPRKARGSSLRSIELLADYSIDALNSQEAAEQAAHEKKKIMAANRAAQRKKRQQEQSDSVVAALDEDVRLVEAQSLKRQKPAPPVPSLATPRAIAMMSGGIKKAAPRKNGKKRKQEEEDDEESSSSSSSSASSSSSSSSEGEEESSSGAALNGVVEEEVEELESGSVPPPPSVAPPTPVKASELIKRAMNKTAKK
jgi:hypothetical protein